MKYLLLFVCCFYLIYAEVKYQIVSAETILEPQTNLHLYKKYGTCPMIKGGELQAWVGWGWVGFYKTIAAYARYKCTTPSEEEEIIVVRDYLESNSKETILWHLDKIMDDTKDEHNQLIVPVTTKRVFNDLLQSIPKDPVVWEDTIEFTMKSNILTVKMNGGIIITSSTVTQQQVNDIVRCAESMLHETIHV